MTENSFRFCYAFRLHISQRLNWFLVLASIVALLPIDSDRFYVGFVVDLIATDRLILIARKIPVFIKSAAAILRLILMTLKKFDSWFDFTFLFLKIIETLKAQVEESEEEIARKRFLRSKIASVG